jgi:Fe-S-cluster containining protein
MTGAARKTSLKSIDSAHIDQLPGRRIRRGETFTFRCHPEVTCFNRCCRNLNLFLYPYDVLRLRQSLGVDSDTFLDRYTVMVMREGNHFPDVLLQMAENDEKTCPFLTEAGCAVYPDRPDSCRTFPVEQGAMYRAGQVMPEVVHFFRPPSFCQGPQEAAAWTIEEWVQDQEAETYNRMTLLFSDFNAAFQREPMGRPGNCRVGRENGNDGDL